MTNFAGVLFLPKSPPVPGSDWIVPHRAPSRTVWKAQARWVAQAVRYGSGAVERSSQRVVTSTAGCIADTSATAHLPGCAGGRRSAVSNALGCPRARPPPSAGRPDESLFGEAVRNPTHRAH